MEDEIVMKITPTKPFFFKSGKRAVLLLHGFTGTSADVRMLGRFLEKKGYTSLAIHYEGHGVTPEELIESGPDQWWQDVLRGYDELIEAGYDEIAVMGLSLGGVYSLKLGYNRPLKGIVTMCAPMMMESTDLMFTGVLRYAREYKRYEGKTDAIVEAEVAQIEEKGMPTIADLRQLVYDVRDEITHLYAPLFVVQGALDKVIDPQSAHVIYNEAESIEKQEKWYAKSGHIVTLGPEKEELHEDIFNFLEKLDWSY